MEIFKFCVNNHDFLLLKRSKTHSKQEHSAPTPAHKRIEGTCISRINNRRQQFPHQKDFNT
jgi:hypothetical protein